MADERDLPTRRSVQPDSEGPPGGHRAASSPSPGGLSPPDAPTLGLPLPGSLPSQRALAEGHGASQALHLKGWDRYQIEGLLGEGGMAQVYKAFDPQLKRHVALKFLRGDDPQWGTRFLQEAQAQAQVDHEHVCKVYEVGVFEGRPYISMQYIAGKTLGEAAREMVLEQKVRVMMRVAEAVHAAHRLGLIHRDLKPSNVLVERTEEGEWRPYVTDFGLAKEQAAPGLTVPGVMMGTPAYMAPEQVRGDVALLDRRSDVYSLGVTLYELLAGKVPFEGSTIDVLVNVMQTDAEPLRKWLPSLPADLETIVLKCLEKEPQRRYESARALAEDLGRFLNGEPVLARRAGVVYKLGKKARRHRAAVILSASALLVIGVLLGLWWNARRSAARVAELAQEFGQEAERMESVLRLGALSPLHDTRGEKALVRQRMREVESRMKRVGRLAAGPGYYALGRGHLALGEAEEAREDLEKAWSVDYRTPQAAYALGRALGTLYQRGLDDLRRLDDEATREARRKELQRDLRDPALAYLKQGAGLTSDSAAYGEGLIALYEQRWDAALAKGAEANRAAPWLYEGRLLEGDTYLERGKTLRDRGDEKGALQDFASAGTAYEAATAVGRSDGYLYQRDGERWIQTFEVLWQTGAVPEGAFRKADAAFDKSIQADPGRAKPWIERAGVWIAWAEERGLGGGRVDQELARAMELLQNAIRCDKGEPEAYFEMALLYEVKGNQAISNGSDPIPDQDRAIANYREAIRLAPRFAEAYSGMGSTLLAKSRSLSQEGRNPVPVLQEAIQAYQEAIRLIPAYAECYNNLGATYRRLAEYQATNREDAREALDKSIEAYRSALKLQPDHAIMLGNLGNAYASRAEYEAMTGRDPSATLDLAEATFRRAVALKPDFSFAYNNLGNACFTRASWLIDRGREPAPYLQEAEESYEKALQVNPSYAFALSNLGNTYLLWAKLAQARGEPPEPYWGKAAESFRRAIRAKPDYANAYRNGGRCCLARAEELAGRGRSPEGALAEGRSAFSRARELNPTDVQIALGLAGISLCEARWARRQQRSPEPALGDAASRLAEAAELVPKEPGVALLQCRLWLERARGLRPGGAGTESVVEQGIAAADRALALDPSLAEAMLARGALGLLRAQGPGTKEQRREAARQARADLQRALATNAFLEREARSLLTEANRLEEQ